MNVIWTFKNRFGGSRWFVIVPLGPNLATILALCSPIFLHLEPSLQHWVLMLSDVLFDRAPIVAAFGGTALRTLIRDQVNSTDCFSFGCFARFFAIVFNSVRM